MKAVVLEIKNDFVAVLTDDGIISKMKNIDYEVGQVIIMKENKIKTFSKRKLITFASAAAVVAVVVLAGFLYYTPVSYVSLDVNPSIEYAVNLFDVVVDVQGVNDDGTEILSELDLSGEKVEDAINTTIDELIDNGYISDDENSGVMISTSNDNLQTAEKLAEELKEQAQEHIDELGKVAVVEAIGVGKLRVDEARKLGVTPGKLNLVEKLKASATDPDSIIIEEWLNKPVKEINKAVKENRKMVKGDQTSSESSSQSLSSENEENSSEMQSSEEEQSSTEIQSSKNLSKSEPSSEMNKSSTPTASSKEEKAPNQNAPIKENKSSNANSNSNKNR